MHNLTKIKLFRLLLRISYPFALLFIYPIVLLKKKNPSHLFFFFDRYAMGGAQRVHLDILEAVADLHKKVFFTRKSPNRLLKKAFYSVPNTENKDIHPYCDFLLIRLFSVHFFAFYLNRHPRVTVLGSNSTFFYDMLPFLHKRTHRIELLHNFTYGKKGMEFFGLANYRYLDKRLLVDEITKKNIQNQYHQYQIMGAYFERVRVIEFGVNVPAELHKVFGHPLTLLYAGRGGPQKRVWLIDQIAASLIDQGSPVEFHFAGTMLDELSQKVKSNSILHGEISDLGILNEIYRKSQVLILTSAYEGFPLFIKEGMAFGCIPLVTALEGNKIHLRHLDNALLVDEVENEKEVVRMAMEHIHTLLKDPDLVANLSGHAYQYAKANFSKQAFLLAYRDLLRE
jgi:L-malate glycosyltransferase